MYRYNVNNEGTRNHLHYSIYIRNFNVYIYINSNNLNVSEQAFISKKTFLLQWSIFIDKTYKRTAKQKIYKEKRSSESR